MYAEFINDTSSNSDLVGLIYFDLDSAVKKAPIWHFTDNGEVWFLA